MLVRLLSCFELVLGSFLETFYPLKYTLYLSMLGYVPKLFRLICNQHPLKVGTGTRHCTFHRTYTLLCQATSLSCLGKFQKCSLIQIWYCTLISWNMHHPLYNTVLGYEPKLFRLFPTLALIQIWYHTLISWNMYPYTILCQATNLSWLGYCPNCIELVPGSFLETYNPKLVRLLSKML